MHADRVACVETRIYRVPTDLPEADGTAQWHETTVVIALVRAESRAIGLGWSYADAAAADIIARVLAPLTVGADPVELPALHARLDREVRNIGRTGVTACAISALDIGLWDLRARSAGIPLTALLGRTRRGVPAYGSGGFTTYDDETTVAQLAGWLERGAAAVKIKIGESVGAAQERDLQRIALARETIGPGIELFIDANGGYGPAQARRVEREARHFGVTWFEEPVTSDHPEQLAALRVTSLADIAAGEYCWRVEDAAALLRAGAVDCLQLDVTRIGGITDWLRAARLAAGHGIEVSAHGAPQLSAQIGVAAPNMRHLEYFHDHARLESLLFDGTVPLRDGMLVPEPDVPGHGLGLSAAAERFRVSPGGA